MALVRRTILLGAFKADSISATSTVELTHLPAVATANAVYINESYYDSTDFQFVHAWAELAFCDAASSATSITSIVVDVTADETTPTWWTFTDSNTITHSGENLGGIIAPISYNGSTTLAAHLNTYFDTDNNGVGSLRVRVTPSAALGHTNVLVWATIEYDFADVGPTGYFTCTARIPLESGSGVAPASMTEIGTNQIPQLTGSGGFLDNAYGSDATVLDVVLVIEGNNAGYDDGLDIQIDSGTTYQSDTDSDLATGMYLRVVMPYTTSAYATTSAHAFKLQANGGWNHVTATLYVTYKVYNEDGQTAALNTCLIWLEPDMQGGATTSSEASRLSASFWVEEPTTITLRQSAVRLDFSAQAAVAGLEVRCGSQSYRSYTHAGAVVAGSYCLQQRVDSGGAQGAGLTLARGLNTITVDLYATDGTDLVTGLTGVLILNYTSGRADGGINTHQHTLLMPAQVASNAVVDRTRTASVALAIPETAYMISSVGGFLYAWLQAAISVCEVSVELGSGEGPAAGHGTMYSGAVQSDNERGCYRFNWRDRGVFKRWPTDPGQPGADIETARDLRVFAPNSATGLILGATYHTIALEIAGTISGSDAGTVYINAHRSDTDELIGSTSRSGNGTYSIAWYDDTIDVYAVAYEDDDLTGRSGNGAAT